MWDWLRAYGTALYDTFWILQGAKEYEFIYHKSLAEELKVRDIDDMDKFNKIVAEELQNTTFHYGHPYLNSGTLAGVLRIALKKYTI